MRHHPHLYQINTWPWLEAQSRRAGRPMTLGTVPDEAWDRLRDAGFDLVYLLGIWQRSRKGRELARDNRDLFPSYEAALPGWRASDVVGSAFSISAFEPDRRIGSFDELDAVREKLHVRGMQIIVDFIPNHLGFDHEWMAEHADRFVSAPEALAREAPDAFRAVETAAGDVRFVACGRDPYFAPWTDVAQLNYANPDTRSAMIEALRTVARHSDGARCDMAMLVLSDVFTRTWGHLTGPAPAEEFWAAAAGAVPGFLLLAEVYWNLERRLQELGFHYTYDKALYDSIVLARADEVGAELSLDAGDQRRCARFIENHDEPRSAAVFGRRVTAAAAAVATLPGLRFYHDGQFEGRRARVPVQLGAVGDEAVDSRLAAFYQKLLACANEPIFHDGEWALLAAAPAGAGPLTVVAWGWRLGRERRVVVVNIGDSEAEASVDVGGQVPDAAVIHFDDGIDGRSYAWRRDDLLRGGLYVRLAPGQAHVFSLRL